MEYRIQGRTRETGIRNKIGRNILVSLKVMWRYKSTEITLNGNPMALRNMPN
ncbi:MAG: hypothetical protein GY861_24540 [bacterium]|nr:hypothetical protein [bacterium]